MPEVSLLTPKGHSIVVNTTREISLYVLFPQITAAEGSGLGDISSPEVYPRPPDALYDFDTVYSSGPDDYEADWPSNTDEVVVVKEKCNEVWKAISSISQEIHDGDILVKQRVL